MVHLNWLWSVGSWSVCGWCGLFLMSNSFLLFIRRWLLVKGRKRRRSRSSVWVLRWPKEKMYLEFATSSPPSMTPLSTSPTSLGSKFTFNSSLGQHFLTISVAELQYLTHACRRNLLVCWAAASAVAALCLQHNNSTESVNASSQSVFPWQILFCIAAQLESS